MRESFALQKLLTFFQKRFFVVKMRNFCIAKASHIFSKKIFCGKNKGNFCIAIASHLFFKKNIGNPLLCNLENYFFTWKYLVLEITTTKSHMKL